MEEETGEKKVIKKVIKKNNKKVTTTYKQVINYLLNLDLINN